MLMFQFKDLDAAMEFYARAKAADLNSEEERIALMYQMATEGKITRIQQTKRTKEQIIEDWSKEYKILDLSRGDQDVSSGDDRLNFDDIE